jgi:hypothetical protein
LLGYSTHFSLAFFGTPKSTKATNQVKKSNRFRDLAKNQKLAVPALNDEIVSHILARALSSRATIGLGFGTGVLMAVVLACV